MTERSEGVAVGCTALLGDNREQVRQLLRDWHARMAEMEKQVGTLMALLQAAPESALVSSVYAVAGMATEATAARIGCCQEWLDAWWLEHNFGEHDMKAGLRNERLRTIETIDDLADLIFDDMTHNAQHNRPASAGPG